MKLCNKECEPLCDFCANFKEFDDDNLSEDCWSDGICKIKNIEVSRLDDCKDDFICFRTVK